MVKVKYIDETNTKKVIEIDEKSLLFYKYIIDYWAELDSHPKYTLDLKIIKMNLFLKIRNIIVGNWRNLTGYTSDETKRRRLICKSCPSNIKYMGIRVCEHCGCPIKSKTTVESEQCLMNKW